MIPNVTASVGALTKDQIGKVMDQHPNVKSVTNKIINAVPKVVEAVKEVTLTKNDSTKNKVKAAAAAIPKIVEAVSDKQVAT